MNQNKTKPLFVTRPYLPSREQYNEYLDEIWQNYTLTNHGPLHNRLKAEISRVFNDSFVTLTTNGHLGLDLAIQVLGVTGEVITTPFSFASTTHALTWRGLTPVFCDVKESDLTIDPEKIEALITERTTAILPVHVYGHLCDMERIGEIARKHSLKVIYDAAHAFGVRRSGKGITDYGDVSMFSFHATKLFHTIEGGALVYSDPALKKPFEAAKDFGIYNAMHSYIGINAKMSEFQAAMGLCILPELPNMINERKRIVMKYVEYLGDVRGIRCLVEADTEQTKHNYAYMPILVDDKAFGCTCEELCNELSKKQINCRRYFYPLIPDFDCYNGAFPAGTTPVASKAARQVLCLPLFNGMDSTDVERVCKCILEHAL